MLVKNIITLVLAGIHNCSCVGLIYFYSPRENPKGNITRSNHGEAMILQTMMMTNAYYNFVILSFRPNWHVCISIN